MRDYIVKLSDKTANLFMTMPLVTFSVLSMVFILLWILTNEVIAAIAGLLLAIILIVLKMTGKIDTFILIFIASSILLGNFCAMRAVLKTEFIEYELNDKTVRASGVISSEPKKTAMGQNFYFSAKHIYYGDEIYDNVKLYLRCGKDEKISFGDNLDITATLTKPVYSEYNMENVIHAKGARMMGFDIIVHNKKAAAFPRNIISGLRRYVKATAEKYFRSDARALFAGITLGDKSYFDEDLTNSLSMAGISHIACVSGLHITLIGYLVYRIFSKINRKAAAFLSIAAVFIFSSIAGSAPSSVRAAVMYTLFILAECFIQQKDSLAALTLSALILMCINPYVIYDLGFLMSFSSVLGITFLSSPIKSTLRFLPIKIADPISATLSAQLFTIPISLLHFGTCAVYSLPTNIIISVIFSPALCMCFILLLVSAIPIVSYAAAGICSFLLTCIAAVAGLFSSLPLGDVKFDNVGMAAIICYFVLLLAVIFSKKINAFWAGAVMMCCAAVMIISSLFLPKDLVSRTFASKTVLFKEDDLAVLLIGDDTEYIADLLTWRGGVTCDIVLTGENDNNFAVGRIVRLTGAEKVYLPEDSIYNKGFGSLGTSIYFYPKDIKDYDELYEYTVKKFFN